MLAATPNFGAPHSSSVPTVLSVVTSFVTISQYAMSDAYSVGGGGGSFFPLPLRAFWTLVTAFTASLVILGLSLADKGRASLYFNPVLCGLDIVLILSLITTAIRAHNFANPEPTRIHSQLTTVSIISAVLLLSLSHLAVAIGLALTGDLSRPRLALRDKDFTMAPTSMAQSVFGIVECLLLLVFTSMCYAGYCDHRDGASRDAESAIVIPPMTPARRSTDSDEETFVEKTGRGWKWYNPFAARSSGDYGDTEKRGVTPLEHARGAQEVQPQSPPCIVQVTVTVARQVESAPASPTKSKRSRPPTWNYLTTFARPISQRLSRMSLLRPPQQSNRRSQAAASHPPPVQVRSFVTVGSRSLGPS
ncbi:hypothetical protein BKA62DRAFT_291471 [Auriculariales sp. MPI-PUGE-AT-0066]|nr:hypothetical protein BKA62DRAFT_291471 [Auriculariales sp. MPI-PUGE-AT-0066]